MPEPRISVVVPVYNAAGTILRTVEALRAQTLPPCEVLLVDDGSTDETPALLRDLPPPIRTIRQANGGPAAARNAGIRAASGEFVAFTDSDCLPTPDWLRHLAAGLDAPDVAGAGGPVRGVDATLTGQYVDAIGLLDPLPDESGAIPYLITANACFRREALVRAGLFDERFRKPGGEEPELCLRIRKLGYRFQAVDAAVVHHHHRQTPGSLLRTIANYGEGLYIFSRICPEYRIERPRRTFWRKAVELRSILRRAAGYAGAHGPGKALYFSLLDYGRSLALVSGYLRASRREG